MYCLGEWLFYLKISLKLSCLEIIEVVAVSFKKVWNICKWGKIAKDFLGTQSKGFSGNIFIDET